ncbi:bifunctional riboflavin kinase/FAD synthetase [Jejuia pallidilutea]|jgi:riboflavin kinase/FMN adenylyltransferase|uniref:Riboflavin biosynthesis protein n=1 Tax=Jejuia pallidilutea TaxID=504487 RepID=A0A090VWQ8_9FLAO|nr:bifunctional riboflavin kinase/FAD synthetase [Jejuia pallidilutea]PQV51618.1 riboflavin kinase/FMN adenylyltransferase [Jejuia pallidilutea]GAL67709.1 riboflavin kinase [Jejuia pallidilutea]GAL71998.1 riboflavin kinase [Jejuia pallidilutea]GAL88338.1 riboflavin kinase [Jejuia pallidilutea]
MGKVLKIENYKSTASTIVTIGTFDGVHIGHQKIINRLINSGTAEGLKSVILTFFPHPRMVLQKDSSIKLINTIEERSNILDNLGLDYLLIKKFTKTFSRLSAEEFVKGVLVDKLNAKKVIIGYDHRFGRNRNADINDLIKYGEAFGFEVEEISAQDINDVAVSSTKIRKALLEGNVIKANRYLGYPFMLTGTVVKGKGIGKQLDYPTANIKIKEDYKLIPKQGAYVVKSIINNTIVFGMMNIGMNPTVSGDSESIEVHFFDFKQSIYGEKLQIDVLERIRDEQKFESVEALKFQLEKDKEFSLNFIEGYNAK